MAARRGHCRCPIRYRARPTGPGARFGPRAIRAAAYEPGTYHLDFGLEIFDWLEVVDFGDAYCPHGQTEISHANIRERVHAVASRGIVPVILGGDHSITWPAATAVADVHGYGNVGIVHFDAHADTADEIEGNLASHGTPMRRLIESGAVPGTHFVQVGLRGYWPPQDVFEWMLEQGMTWHTMQEIWDRGFKDVMRDAVGEALAKAEKLYVSVDIDVLDPAHAPGTGTPEPGGLTSADLLRLVRQLCYEHDVAGVDVVEVAPAYDHAELTINAAHRVVFEALVRHGGPPPRCGRRQTGPAGRVKTHVRSVDLLDRLRLDVPVAQAGMGGGLAGADLALAVAAAGGLGTLGLAPAAQLRDSITRVRDGAADRAVAVNLLMPFVRRSHVAVCTESRIDVAVVAFGGDEALVRQLKESGVFVLAMVGTEQQARRAIHWGADGLIAQGCEAGGHLAGNTRSFGVLAAGT